MADGTKIELKRRTVCLVFVTQSGALSKQGNLREDNGIRGGNEVAER